MRRLALITMWTTILLAPTSTLAQAPPPEAEVGLAASALVTLPARSGAKLTVTSPAFRHMGDIPFQNTQYQGNTFPGLEWTAGPAGTMSYALIMQDTDSRSRRPARTGRGALYPGRWPAGANSQARPEVVGNAKYLS